MYTPKVGIIVFIMYINKYIFHVIVYGHKILLQNNLIFKKNIIKLKIPRYSN